MHSSSTKEMHLCLALVTILVAASSAVHPRVEILKARILANLGMARFPDMDTVNTSESEMQRMMRKYERSVRRSKEEIITFDDVGCKRRSHVTFNPKLSNDTDIVSASLKFPDNTSRDVSVWAKQWRHGNGQRRLVFVVPCRKSRTLCCKARLQVRVRQRDSRRENCKKWCCRNSLKISFKDDFGWDWVLQPKVFEAFYCKGSCDSMEADVANTHALIQTTLFYRKHNVPLPCCSPMRMRPLLILHYNDKHPDELQVTTHKDMVIAHCACA